jgi:hypothetical protein
MKIANRFFEGVTKFKYLGTALTDQNCMHEIYKILVGKARRKETTRKTG